MYVQRKLQERILKYINSPEIIAIVGPRQSGKTTLLQHIFPRYEKNGVFLSFEDPEILSMFERNTTDFVNLYVKGKKYLFIDEFQYAKNGGKILKQIYDQNKIKIIITGSSSIDLTVKALRYLVGRIFIFELFPFDFEEFLKAKDIELYNFYQRSIEKNLNKLSRKRKLSFGELLNERLKKYFEEYLIYGGYPRVVLSSDFEEKREILKGIYSTYFLREVKDYLGLIDDYKLQKLIQALSLQIGSLIDYKELSSLSGYSFVSLKKYLNFLEKTYIACLMRPFFRNKRKEIVKNPKVYFLDTGLRNYIINDFRNLDVRLDGGALLENGVFINLIKKGHSPRYWRSKRKREIDFILEKEKIALEVKLDINKCKKDANLNEFLNSYPDFKSIFTYFRGFSPKIEEKGIIRLPCFMI